MASFNPIDPGLVSHDQPTPPIFQEVSAAAHVSLDNAVDQTFKTIIDITETVKFGPKKSLENKNFYQILPPLAGQFPNIGYTSFVLNVPQEFVSSSQSDKAIGIEIFAPTKPDPLENKLFIVRDEEVFLEPLNAQQRKTLHTHASDQLSQLEQLPNTPVVIFSHGMGASPRDYRPLIEELASHGFTVVTLNHPSSSGHAPFRSQEQAILNDLLSPGEKAAAQAANIHFLIGQIHGGQQEQLSKRIDSSRQIILAGHSLGGAASIMASRNNPSIVGCINLDGRLHGKAETKVEGLAMPLLLMSTDHSGDEENLQVDQEWKTLVESSPQSIHKHISGAGHGDFALSDTLMNWMLDETSEEKIDPTPSLDTHKVASQEILKFITEVVNKRQKS